MNYDIVHKGWALNETPINEMDLLDKLAKWQPLFNPLEVRESEIEDRSQVWRKKDHARRAHIR